MRRILKQKLFTVTFNKAFKQVVEECATIKRSNQNSTWITQSMVEAYCNLHRAGHAKSVEVWQNTKLVGGLYGVDLKNIFCGESMFSKVNNASKVAFITLAQQLQQENYKLIDCQIYTQHLASLGAEEVERDVFLSFLK